jgi:hypothetical protein
MTSDLRWVNQTIIAKAIRTPPPVTTATQPPRSHKTPAIIEPTAPPDEVTGDEGRVQAAARAGINREQS